MIHRIYSPSVFVGRQYETFMMDRMLHADCYTPLPESKFLPEWILSIHGEGGVGKTQLLRHFIQEAYERHLDEAHHTVNVTHNPIDLYLSQHQTEPGILKSLADQLSEKCFEEFHEKYPKISNEEDIRELFLKCYRKLPQDHIVLLFDTLERASNAALRFFREFLPQLRQGGDVGRFGTFVVIAGRKPLNPILEPRGMGNHATEMPSNLLGVKTYLLKGLSEENIKDYFARLTPERQRRRITPEFITRVATLSEGRPVLIALIIDWLNYGNLPEDLTDVTSEEEFEKLLVEQVQELRTVEDQIIWAMAHLDRRFDKSFAKAIFGFSELEAQETISSLTRFSFVKTHGSSKNNNLSCSLHDEMQALVSKYVLQKVDPNGDLRKEWSQKAVDYYGGLITESNSKGFKDRQVLERERLFYWLQADVDKAIEYWRYLYEKAHSPYEKESLNYEVSYFQNQLSVEYRLELQFREALVLYERLHYDLALRQFNEVIERTTDEVLKGKIYPWIVYSFIHLGAIDKALGKGKEYEAWFNKHLTASTHTDETHKKIKGFLGQLLNAIGFAYRSKSDYENAIRYYEKSIEQLSCLPSNDYYIASTRTNLAYLCHAMGKDRVAQAHGQDALRIAEHSFDYRQAALTHNVLGIIAANSLRGQQAINHFQFALDYLSQAEDARGLAMVKLAMGRMHRRIGWYKVNPVRQELESTLGDYEAAGTLFKKALEDIGDSNLEIQMEIYHEQATLLREQGSFDEAVGLYQKSKCIAEKISSPLNIAYNLLGLGVTYNLQGEYLKSRDAAERAAEFNEELNSIYLVGRVERILADVFYHSDKNYNRALDKAVESCVKVLSSDMYSFTNSSAVREMLHDEWIDWLIELIQNLPSQELRVSKSEYIIQRWEKDKLLAEYYPGLGIRLTGLITYWRTRANDSWNSSAY